MSYKMDLLSDEKNACEIPRLVSPPYSLRALTSVCELSGVAQAGLPQGVGGHQGPVPCPLREPAVLVGQGTGPAQRGSSCSTIQLRQEIQESYTYSTQYL